MGLIKDFIKRIPPISKLLGQRDGLLHEAARLSAETGLLKNRLEQVCGELNEALRYKTYYAPGHFYSPIPSLQLLSAREEVFFNRNGALPADIDLNTTAQLELIRILKTYYEDLPFEDRNTGRTRFHFDNPNFTHGDAIFYFAMIRHLKPKRLVEIGCGYSSCVALDVNELYFQNSIECTFIEPFPQLLYSLLKPADQDRVTIIQDYLQEVPLHIFAGLEAGDILFIDSSHISKTDSDLNHILFYILPILDSGVHIHFHDIFYPFEYPKEWIHQGRAFNESYILRAFLSHNHDFTIELFSSYLTTQYREVLAGQMPLCVRNEGGSLWLKKTGGRRVPLASLDALDERRLTPPGRRRMPASITAVDLVHVAHPGQLGAGWYEYEKELSRRWMAEYAEVRIAAPARPGQRLWLEAFQMSREPVTVSVSANGYELGNRILAAGPRNFRESFVLPDALIGAQEMMVAIRVDKTSTVPGDRRKLGLGFGKIFID